MRSQSIHHLLVLGAFGASQKARRILTIFALTLVAFIGFADQSQAQTNLLPPWLRGNQEVPTTKQEAATLPPLQAPPPPIEGAGLPEKVPAIPATPEEAGVFQPPKVDELLTLKLDGNETQFSDDPWYYPWSWIPWDGWQNSAEVGVNGTDGNSLSMSFHSGAKFKRKTDINSNELRISYQKTEANGVETQNNALMYYDYERFFGESRWTLFGKAGLEYDQFKAFDIRFNTNGGVGYKWLRGKALNFSTRFGAGTSREFGGPDDRWVPEAVFGFDYDHQINKRNKFNAKVDYFPEWTEFANFRMVADVSWEYLLDDAGNLSFKLGANDRYDSTPNGRKPNDVNYNFTLVYKF